MSITRRQLVRGATGALAGTALLTAPGCGRTDAGAPGLSLWYWNRSVSDQLLAQVPRAVPSVEQFNPQKVGGDFKAKLLTSLAGRAYVPDITGINDDIATYFPNADQFVDLYELGAGEVQDQYLDWKWQFGVSPEGKMIGFPMDTGPTALYYRVDLFEQAGLPTDPDDVAAAAHTWEDYLDLGAEFTRAQPERSWLPDIVTVFIQVMAQSPRRYLDRQNRFIGDEAHVRRAWDLAVAAYERQLDAQVGADGPDWNAAVGTGHVPTFVDAVWRGQILIDAATQTAGKWRVCRAPGGAGNDGGSFLGITKYCQDPQLAFDVIRWLMTPENQVTSYVQLALFPSTPESYEDPRMRKPQEFYGGQRTVDVFAESARNVKPAYLSPYDGVVEPVYTTELTNIWSLGKDPRTAWRDAMDTIERELAREGLV